MGGGGVGGLLLHKGGARGHAEGEGVHGGARGGRGSTAQQARGGVGCAVGGAAQVGARRRRGGRWQQARGAYYGLCSGGCCSSGGALQVREGGSGLLGGAQRCAGRGQA